MSLIVLIILFAVLGVGLGLLFNKLVCKDYPEAGRKFKYVITVIVFFLITVALFAVIYAKIQIDAYVKKSSVELEQYINKNYSNIDFVKKGLDITAVKNDVSKLNEPINDLRGGLRKSAVDLGVPNFVYDMFINYLSKELQNKFTAINKTGQTISDTFVDENNKITVSSLINGFQTSILNFVKTTVIVIIVIFAVLLGIYIFVSISKASKEKKRIESATAG